MEMPELKCCSKICHIPGLGFRKGSSPRLGPQAMKTWIQITEIHLLACIREKDTVFTLLNNTLVIRYSVTKLHYKV